MAKEFNLRDANATGKDSPMADRLDTVSSAAAPQSAAPMTNFPPLPSLAGLDEALTVRAPKPGDPPPVQPGQVANLPPEMCSRWLDLTMGPDRLTELRGIFVKLRFRKASPEECAARGWYVKGASNTEIWVGDKRIDDLIDAQRREKKRRADLAIQTGGKVKLVDRVAGEVMARMRTEER